MLVASALDESKDEVIIHLTASSMPLAIAIIIRYIITRETKIMPFMKYGQRTFNVFKCQK